MKNLLTKEFALAMHPTVPMFLALSLMLLIPNYPYYVVFFYTALGLFFVCLSGRENNDIPYTLTLPVRKRDAVKSRIVFAVLVELTQFALAACVAVLRAKLGMGANQAGMDANIALFGLSFVMMGLFNRVFFVKYYSAPDKVGKAFAVGATVTFVFIVLAEACAFALPFFRDRLDTPDPMYLTEKLLTLALGMAFFALLTWNAYQTAAERFEKLDL